MKKLVFLLHRVHLYPFRTQKLSCAKPKILARRRAGKIGQCQHFSFLLEVEKHRKAKRTREDKANTFSPKMLKSSTTCTNLTFPFIYFLIISHYIYSSLAQLAEHLTVNQVVAGSSPAGGAIQEWHEPLTVRVFLFAWLLRFYITF